VASTRVPDSMSADMTRAKELHARLAELAGDGVKPT
jgi:hypothetical protein